jgi:phasin
MSAIGVRADIAVRRHHVRYDALYSQEGIMNKEPEFAVPSEMRSMAEKSVAQAKQAFEGFMTAAQKAANLAEGQASTAHFAAKEASSMAIEFAERSMTSAFVLAQKLVQARDLEEMLKLQADYVRSQIEALTEQARDIGKLTNGQGTSGSSKA